mgnify:CR=1 FL=1
MRFRLISSLFVAAFLIAGAISCKKTETYPTEAVGDFLPLQVGKYITYRLDSMVFSNFGRNIEIHRYQVKHVIDAQVTDNLGRTSFRVYTYIRDSAGTGYWNPNGTYYITPLDKQTEVIEDNMRVIKLHAPMTEGFQWKGNSYLAEEPYKTGYDLNNDNNMRDWDFAYEAPEASFSYQGKNYTDVYTVLQQDDSFNVPTTDLTKYAFQSQFIEKYAKNIGLVYSNHLLWEYQPNVSGPSAYRVGFGVTMWMIDHN